MKLIFFTLLLVVSPHAFAYLDPGSASLIIQGLIAGIASVATVIGLYWQKIKSLFSNKVDNEGKATTEDADQRIV